MASALSAGIPLSMRIPCAPVRRRAGVKPAAARRFAEAKRGERIPDGLVAGFEAARRRVTRRVPGADFRC